MNSFRTRIATKLFVGLFGLLVALAPLAAETLRSGDTILLTVHGEPKISGEYSIAASGVISHPLLGDIPAKGKTTEQLSLTIVDLLKDGYIHDPKVGVVLIDQKLSEIHVVGEVKHSNNIRFDPDDPFDLKTAIGMAGNANPDADLLGVEIKRGKQTIKAPMPASGGMVLRDGDVVSVPELSPLGFFSISGQVRTPNNYEIPRGRDLTVFAAINMAGGPTRAAKLSNTTVTRILASGETKTWKIDASDRSITFVVQPGDEIVVKARVF